MPRARIGVRQNPEGITLIYRLPARLIHPIAVVWAVVGGAAVGIGAALGLTAWRVIEPSESVWLFRAVLAAGWGAAALLLYGAVYLPAARGIMLRVGFGTADQTITFWLPGTRGSIPFAATTVLGFRLDEPDDRAWCALVADLDNAAPLVLLRVDQDCEDEQADLPRLSGLLNTELARLQPRRSASWARPNAATESPTPDEATDHYVPD